MDFDERDGDFDMQIIDVQKDHKVFTNQIIQDPRIQPAHKARLHIPLCHIIFMPIIRLALLVNGKKMEHNFQMGYKELERTFYVSTINNKGAQEMVTPKLLNSWDIHQ